MVTPAAMSSSATSGAFAFAAVRIAETSLGWRPSASQTLPSTSVTRCAGVEPRAGRLAMRSSSSFVHSRYAAARRWSFEVK